MFILKLIILFLVAMGIWHLLQRFGGDGAARQARGPRPFGNIFGGFQQAPPQQPQQPPQPQQRSGGGAAPAPAAAEAVDLVKCRQCGAYIAATGAKSCGRGDCPQPI